MTATPIRNQRKNKRKHSPTTVPRAKPASTLVPQYQQTTPEGGSSNMADGWEAHPDSLPPPSTDITSPGVSFSGAIIWVEITVFVDPSLRATCHATFYFLFFFNCTLSQYPNARHLHDIWILVYVFFPDLRTTRAQFYSFLSFY